MLRYAPDGPSPEAPLPSGEALRRPSFGQLLQENPNFQELFKASRTIDRLSHKGNFTTGDYESLSAAKRHLNVARVHAEHDTQVPPSLPLRIAVHLALADPKAYSGVIAERSKDERVVQGYTLMVMKPSYRQLLDIARLVNKGLDTYGTETTEGADLAGFGQELTFHGLHYRQPSARRFSTPGTAFEDYLGRAKTRFDARVYNNGDHEVSQRDVQITTTRFRTLAAPYLLRITGQDMHNRPHSKSWVGTPYEGTPLPLLGALIGESEGDTSITPTIDAINADILRKTATSPLTDEEIAS